MLNFKYFWIFFTENAELLESGSSLQSADCMRATVGQNHNKIASNDHRNSLPTISCL